MHASIDRFADRYGSSESLTVALSFDYLFIYYPLWMLYLVTNYGHWKNDRKLESILRPFHGIFSHHNV